MSYTRKLYPKEMLSIPQREFTPLPYPNYATAMDVRMHQKGDTMKKIVLIALLLLMGIALAFPQPGYSWGHRWHGPGVVVGAGAAVVGAAAAIVGARAAVVGTVIGGLGGPGSPGYGYYGPPVSYGYAPPAYAYPAPAYRYVYPYYGPRYYPGYRYYGYYGGRGYYGRRW